MKKLISVILILALILPAFALASGADPIVGCWYIFIDLTMYPELVSTFGDYDQMLSLYYFDGSGLIYGLENDVKDGAATPIFSGAGKWEKTLFGYNVSIIGFGDVTITVDGDIAMLKANSNGAMKLRRLIPFNPYADYSF